MSTSNQTRIFTASCVALIVTAMTFAIRAGTLTELSNEFGLTDNQLGWMNSMAFSAPSAWSTSRSLPISSGWSCG